MTCDYAMLDGAYVLGALSPAERQDFERHLTGCPRCSHAVRELAGLPGLLAHVRLEDLGPADDPPAPASLLPSLLREVRSTQRRRSTVTVAVAATVTAVAAAGALAAGAALGGGDVAAGPSTGASASATATPTAMPMQAVGPSPVGADVVMSSVPWGTRLDLTCSYAVADEEYEALPDAAYVLVLLDRNGRREQVATWRGLPGRTMHLSAATATARADIAAVEMRTSNGVLVLRLRL